MGVLLSVWDKIHVFSDTSVIGGLFNKSVGGNGPEFVSFSLQIAPINWTKHSLEPLC